MSRKFQDPLRMVWVWLVNKWEKNVLEAKGWEQPYLQTLKCGWTQRNYFVCTFFNVNIHRLTELQTPKGTWYTGEWKFFVPDFNKLPQSLRSHGDNFYLNRRVWKWVPNCPALPWLLNQGSDKYLVNVRGARMVVPSNASVRSRGRGVARGQDSTSPTIFLFYSIAQKDVSDKRL